MIGKIYLIENKINNKKYVGKTYLTLDERFTQHVSDSKKPSINRPLYNAFNKHGVENFSIQLLGEFEEGVLEEKEIEFIKTFDSYNNGYNATLGGDGKRYFEHSDESVIEKYKELRFVNLTASYFKCGIDTIRAILKSNNIKIERHYTDRGGKRVFMMDMDGNFINSFKDYFEASSYLVENNYTNSKSDTVRKGIGKAVIGKRKSYLGFKWVKK